MQTRSAWLTAVGTIVQRVPPARRPRPGRIIARLLAPLLLLAVAAAIYFIVTSPNLLGHHTGSTAAKAAAKHRPPPYWTVRPGDTLASISAATGVPINSLEAQNPSANEFALIPGQRLLLWAHPPPPPKPKPKPLGPMFWTVKPGESFGSVAAATGIDITTLENLNPKLKPSSVQPGDRIRLRK
jgi:LysM repeat protein